MSELATPFYSDAWATIHHGDSREVLRCIASGSVDSIVTDPPYELGFMGKRWDADGIAFNVELWRECLRILKPGGHLLAFGGTRTYHRMACAIEDAGFEIRDQIGWVYGSGFPKSLDVSKAIDKAAGVEREVLSAGKAVKRMIPGADQNGTGSWIKDNGRIFIPTETAPATEAAKQWDGWGTALKPAWEPICVARKPLGGTVAANVQTHGVGALNIDGCRISTEDVLTGSGTPPLKYGGENHRPFHDEAQARGCNQHAAGRWPANIIHDGSEEVTRLFPAEAGQQGALATRNSDKTRNTFSPFASTRDADFQPHDERGSAARFFYCAKASRSERGESNTHPTVKPVALIQYLIRLVTPKGGLVVDPFLGSGTAGIAAKLEGMRLIGIDREEEHCAIAAERIVKPVEVQEEFFTDPTATATRTDGAGLPGGPDRNPPKETAPLLL